MFQRALHALGVFAICLSLVPLAAHAADTGGSSVDDLNARMRDAARTTGKEKTLDQMLAPHMPTIPLHTEFVVETNSRGQVARIRSGKNSKDPTFDLLTYGNALQTFIRTQSGHADAGTFRITYDYSPKTRTVARDVSVISLGGVNPSAEGAVHAMAREQAAAAAHSKSQAH